MGRFDEILNDKEATRKRFEQYLEDDRDKLFKLYSDSEEFFDWLEKVLVQEELEG